MIDFMLNQPMLSRDQSAYTGSVKKEVLRTFRRCKNVDSGGQTDVSLT